MTHTELTIQFALQWEVYFILYVCIGLFSIIEMIIFFAYHQLLNRDIRPEFFILAYLPLFYPNSFSGILLGCIVLGIPITACAVIMTGTFWDITIFTYDCNADKSICKYSVFDEIPVNFYFFLDIYIIIIECPYIGRSVI